ncbi:Protein-L-isoaspartate O-methyltransferase [Actinopolyspora xinjiangensis]|uniref:Protein-L-isoaspartate O-methyltransferase n=2 Tax=Actinopolyspora xinjiangensis TaxID=405564 RepID=A0A1H0VD36_9ACTN|nr:Protein-L-isoaspartate O-methyltransferase [Actinopolyspora xinjiangensis]
MTVAASDDGVRALIEELHSAGDLPAECRSALEAVPREWFIPARMWVQETEDEPYQPVDRAEEPARWARAVYSNRVIVTQFDDGATEWPEVGDRPTCSASMPSVVVGMLAELDARPGHVVFEVGTGTGWSAALLAHIVGAQGKVTTVEIDPVLAADARKRLEVAGFTEVDVRLADGVADVLPDMVDHVIATAGVHMGQLPYPWVAHTRPGGLILAPMRADLASGPLVRFVVGDDGTASGCAAAMQVGFMELRSHRVASDPVGGQRFDDPAAEITYTDLAPWVPLLADDHRWPIAVAVPSCRINVWERTEDRPGVAWLRDPLSGSWATVVPESKGRYVVRQFGPRRLWDAAEAAYRWWQERGEPPLSAWEWTITPDRQSVTLPPDSGR